MCTNAISTVTGVEWWIEPCDVSIPFSVSTVAHISHIDVVAKLVIKLTSIQCILVDTTGLLLVSYTPLQANINHHCTVRGFVE